MGYLETGMCVDSAQVFYRDYKSWLCWANDTNTEVDAEAIDREAEAIADEFHRLMSTSTYKGKDLFVSTAGGEYVSMGGRDAEMTFGLGEVEYQEMYIHTSYDAWEAETGVDPYTTARANSERCGLATTTVMKGSEYTATGADLDDATDIAAFTSDGAAVTAGDDFTAAGTGVITDAAADGSVVVKTLGQLRYSASEGMYTDDADGTGNPQTNLLTTVVQNVQAKINTARVQAGSQYAALESAVNYTIDLTAQYELGYNTVNDVNLWRQLTWRKSNPTAGGNSDAGTS